MCDQCPIVDYASYVRPSSLYLMMEMRSMHLLAHLQPCALNQTLAVVMNIKSMHAHTHKLSRNGSTSMLSPLPHPRLALSIRRAAVMCRPSALRVPMSEAGTMQAWSRSAWNSVTNMPGAGRTQLSGLREQACGRQGGQGCAGTVSARSLWNSPTYMPGAGQPQLPEPE